MRRATAIQPRAAAMSTRSPPPDCPPTDRPAAMPSDEPSFERVSQLWWLVFLRGFVPSALALVLIAAPALSLQEAAWTAAAVVALGSAIELAVAWRLRGIGSRGTLWFTGLIGLAAGGLVLATATTTLALLLTVMGAWLAIRGLAALWAALSMNRSHREWLLPLATAFLSAGAGVVLLFWTTLKIGALIAPAVIYALCHGALHAVAARRIRTAPHRWVRSPD